MDGQFEYQFEWDPSKAQRNAREHKVSFEEAVGVFSDADALSQYDTEHSNGEDRWITLGMDQAGRLLVVYHISGDHQNSGKSAYLFSAQGNTRRTALL